MIFWIFVILTVLGIALYVAIGEIGSKHSYKDEENTRLVEFCYHKGDPIIMTSIAIGIISGIIVISMIVAIITSQVSADGVRQQYEQRYKALVYKSQTESIRDEFGIVNKEYIDEVQAWNEDLAKYQSYSHNFWIGIFYPKRQYDGLEFIELENIKMRG